MTCPALVKGAQFACIAFIAGVLTGCERGERWEVVHLKVEAVRVQGPIESSSDSGGNVEEPGAPILLELKITTVAEPNAIPAPQQTMAVVRSLGPQNGEHDDCTGFFVSSKDFLTAKHCLNKASEIDIDLGKVEGTRTAKCTPSKSEDLAICSVEGLDFQDAFPLTSCVPKPNTRAVIMGFCRLTPQGEPDPNPGPPNAGVVELLPVEAGFLPARPLEDTHTSSCHLDSGGPAFTADLNENGNIFEASGAIRVIGVISEIGKCPEGEADRTCIEPTTDEEVLTFLGSNVAGTITILDCAQ